MPGITVVGIGYTRTVAWSLTTGNSKTIDTFVETLRPDSNSNDLPRSCGTGAWTNLDCRTETVRWREAPQGVPAGPPPLRSPPNRTMSLDSAGPVVSPAIGEIDEPDGEPAMACRWAHA